LPERHYCRSDDKAAALKVNRHGVLLFAVCVSFTYGLVEACVGWYGHSLALISDAGHMFTDAFALLLAWFATWFSQRPPSKRHTYGFARIEVLAAALNALFMLAIILWIFIEAFERLFHPEAVAGGSVFIVALIGLVLNLVIAFGLSADQGEGDLNTRSALVHVMGDLWGSVGALASGGIIMLTDWTIVDPILSVLISCLVLYSVWSLLKESFLVLMEGVPGHIDLGDIEAALLAEPSIASVTDLHVWNLSSGYIALSAHIAIDALESWPQLCGCIEQMLKTQFKIGHVTIQPEVHS
jgi:cobalt-zinc-cadmium efflux system protein